MANKIYRDLRKLLAEFYPQASSIRRIVDDSNGTALYINFNSSAIDIWHSVLIEAKDSGWLCQLLEIIEDDYNSNEDLRKVLANYRQAQYPTDYNSPAKGYNHTFAEVVSALQNRNYRKADGILDKSDGPNTLYFRAISLLRGKYPSQRTPQILEIIDNSRMAFMQDNSQSHYYYLYAWIIHDYFNYNKRVTLEKDYTVDDLLRMAKNHECKLIEMNVLYSLVLGIKQWLVDKINSRNA